MAHEQATIVTPDGPCPGHVFKPAAGGVCPSVIFFMDGFGIRPTLFNMAQRLADAGYIVLLPDLFYRMGPYDPIDMLAVFARGDVRKAVAEMFGHPTNLTLAMKDVGPLLGYLSGRDDVADCGFGTVGYCMGGAFALAAAGLYPQAIAAAASFHGGYLVTDSALSPDRLAASMRGAIYIAAAENDPNYPADMAAQLEHALTAAGVDFRAEVYAGAAHGWNMPDTPRYHHEAAERHWRELIAFFAAHLRPGPQAAEARS